MTLGLPPHRARGGHDLLIRRNRRIVQSRPLRFVRWVDIPQLSTRDQCCPAAWQQYWQQCTLAAMVMHGLRCSLETDRSCRW